MNKPNSFPKSVLSVIATVGTLCVIANFSLPEKVSALPSGGTATLRCKCMCTSDTVGSTVFGYVNRYITILSGDGSNHCPSENNQSCKVGGRPGKTSKCNEMTGQFAPKRSAEGINPVPGKDAGTLSQPSLPNMQIQQNLPGNNLRILPRGLEEEQPAETTPDTSSPTEQPGETKSQ